MGKQVLSITAIPPAFGNRKVRGLGNSVGGILPISYPALVLWQIERWTHGLT
jgi:hypothetical protein